MSVYQTNGRPLSQQALYQQKLRHGVYDSPGKPIVGVNSNASDAAALLAASSDLTVKPSYERLHAAPEAHTAALAAKFNLIPAWKREATDPYADSAAASAKVAKPVETQTDLGIPLYNKGSVYRQASANSTSTMTSRTTPEKLVMKHGLASKTSTISTSSLNIGKISQVADKNSSKLLNDRFNPEADFRSGVQSQPAEFLTADEEKLAAQSASRSLTMKHGAGYSDSVSAQKRSDTFKASDVVDATLLAAATARANERLNSIRSTAPADLKEQAKLYSRALATAQKNSDERLKAHNAGTVDLGGGLFLPISEIDKLASLIVQPVLLDIGSKAAAQRESDNVAKEKQLELVKQHQLFKIDALVKRQHEKLDREQAQKERVEANEAKKAGEDEAYTAYQGERNAEVDAKTQELRELQEKHAGEKEALLKEKQDNEERVTEEETGLITGRKEELEGMQSERDEILKPTLDELKEETAKLTELTDSKTQLTSEVEASEKTNAEYEAKLAELKDQLEKTAAEIEQHKKDVEETAAKREETDKEVAELQGHSATELENADKSHKELDDQLAQLEKEKEEHIATKVSHKKEISLEIEDKIKEEHKINKELPEHLQLEIDEARFKDTGSLFSAEPVVTKHEAPAPVVAPIPTTPAKGVATEKKKGFRSRLKAAFNTPSPARTAPATVASTLQPKRSVVESKKSVPVTSAESSKDRASEVSNFDEELSIKGQSKKGGLFKEEI